MWARLACNLAGIWLAGALAAPARAQDAPGGMADMPGKAEMANMPAMSSSFGPYAMARDGSGTSWQPDASNHDGVDFQAGGWMMMAHGLIDGVYDSQSGPRGGDKGFAEGMVMGMAQHSLGQGNALELRAMLSPDPFMGADGYPLLLGTGETANGRTPLVDRQHPHNLVMELAAAVSHRVGGDDSIYVYAGLPGEPALGPPAFMHRQSGMDNPEAPITHHWLDSTHISNGVITTGWAHGNLKAEISGFNGREPDQHRFAINTPRLDSFAARLSWNPGANWALQTSWGHLTSPEQLEPTINEDRWTASAIYTRPLGKTAWWATTAAIGIKHESYGQTLRGVLLESALRPSAAWTIFGRAEIEQNNELLAADMPAPPLPGPTTAYTVGKIDVGAIHDWRLAPHLQFGVGALHDWIFVPAPLTVAYGNDPRGTMVFIRLKVS